ncbi:MAG: polynucleotide adenylyltransferase PcnB, partial [Gammaproteobacteria bacterium]
TANLLSHVSSARLFDEVLKLLSGGYGQETFALLRHYDLLKYLLPLTEDMLKTQAMHQEVDRFLMAMLRNTDERIAQDKGVNPAFMFAAMLWYPRQKIVRELLQDELIPILANEQANNQVISQQIKHIAIPRRITNTMREIWQLQFQLEKRKPQRVLALVHMHRFRAAYDFLLLRAEVETQLVDIATWWTAFYDANEETKNEMIKTMTTPKKRRRRSKGKTTTKE